MLHLGPQPPQVLREPLHEPPEKLPLALERVPPDRLVAASPQPLYLCRTLNAQAFQRTDVAAGIVHADLYAVLAEAAIGAVPTGVRGDNDCTRGHRLQPWHVETLLHERRGEKDIRPVVELAQLGPADRVPDGQKLEVRRAGEHGGDLVTHIGLPRRVADLDRGAKAAAPLFREEVRVVAEVYDLGHGRRVQVRPHRFQDHVVRHNAGHRAREQAHGVAAREGRVGPANVLHDKDYLLVAGPPAKARLQYLVVRRPGEEGELVRGHRDLLQVGKLDPVFRRDAGEPRYLEDGQARLVLL